MRAYTNRSTATPPTATTPLIGPEQTQSPGFIQILSGLFGTPHPPPETGRQAHAIQRNDQWLQRLGADTESRAIASQHPELQRAISALLDADPPVVELRTQDGETSCVFVEPGPTQDSVNHLASIGRQLLQLNNPAAARLLATAWAAARQGFPDREAELLRDSGLALQNSKAGLPFQTLMALCLRTAELVDLGFMTQDDGLLFEAAACRSPQGAPHGLNLCLRRLRTALKALSDQPAQDRPADAMARLGREIDGLHHQCRTLDQREPAKAAIQLLTDLVALANGTPAHTTLSTTLDRLIDAQRRFFDAPLGVAAWYPGLLEGGDPRLAAQTYEQRLDASAEPAVRHGQLCNCLSTLVQQGPDRPWSTWAAHLEFAARAFPQQHDARFDVALCVDWVCARPGDAAERLDSLWACMAATPAPHKALRLQDMERLVELMLGLPAEASIKAFNTYMGLVHPKLNRRLEPLWTLLDAHRQLSGGTAPRDVLEQLVTRLSQGKHPMARLPEWDFLVRRLLGRLLARDKSIDMANAPALRALLLNHAVSAEDPLSALDNTIDLMRTVWQSVQAGAAVHVPSGAPADHLPDFCTVLCTHLQHRFGFGGHDPDTAIGAKRHAEQLMDACLSALQQPSAPGAPSSTVSLASPRFPDVYPSLVSARLAQRRQDAHAKDLVRQTVNLHMATLKNKPYLQRLDRLDPAWKDYGARLQNMVDALGN